MQEVLDANILSVILSFNKIDENNVDHVNPIPYLTMVKKDTMYFDQAMKQHNAHKFVKAIINEINDHVNKKHYKLIYLERRCHSGIRFSH